jgi:hypothetical protein
MEINLDVNARKVLPDAAPPPAQRLPGSSNPTNTEFRAAAALDRALESRPDIRPERVQEAKLLVGQPTYPPRETIQKLASLLAMHLDS